MTKTFDNTYIHVTEEKGSKIYYFSEDLLSSHADIFSHFDSYLQVERELKTAGVLVPNNKGKSGGRLFIAFKTEVEGERFINRLNAYFRRLYSLFE